MSRRSPAARIMQYVKSAPIDELRVVLEMAREEYRSRVESEEAKPNQPTVARVGRPRKARKSRGSAPALPLENEAAAS